MIRIESIIFFVGSQQKKKVHTFHSAEFSNRWSSIGASRHVWEDCPGLGSVGQIGSWFVKRGFAATQKAATTDLQ